MTRDPFDAARDYGDVYTVCPACTTTFLFEHAEACECGEWLHPECLEACPHKDQEEAE